MLKILVFFVFFQLCFKLLSCLKVHLFFEIIWKSILWKLIKNSLLCPKNSEDFRATHLEIRIAIVFNKKIFCVFRLFLIFLAKKLLLFSFPFFCLQRRELFFVYFVNDLKIRRFENEKILVNISIFIMIFYNFSAILHFKKHYKIWHQQKIFM